MATSRLNGYTSRKFTAWLAIFGSWVVFTGVFLRTCSRAAWLAYEATMSGKQLTEASSALRVMGDAWQVLTYVLAGITLAYMGSNLAEKFIGFKFNGGSETGNSSNSN